MIGSMLAGLDNFGGSIADHIAAKEASEYQHKAQMLGRHRLAPEEVRELVARHPTDTVARSMVVFATGGAVYNLRLHPYFLPDPVPPPPPPSLWESLGSPSSELIFGAAFLSFMGGASLVKGEAEIYSVLVLLLTAALATAGYLVRGKERQAAAQIARDKAAAEASPPPS